MFQKSQLGSLKATLHVAYTGCTSYGQHNSCSFTSVLWCKQLQSVRFIYQQAFTLNYTNIMCLAEGR